MIQSFGKLVDPASSEGGGGEEPIADKTENQIYNLQPSKNPIGPAMWRETLAVNLRAYGKAWTSSDPDPAQVPD